MIIAAYIGDHRKDGLLTRIGWWVTRATQRYEFRRVTHVEMVLTDYRNGFYDIGSSSLRDGGVRIKKAEFTPGNWMFIDVPSWDADKARAAMVPLLGAPYDWRGAVATVLPAMHDPERWFCNELIGHCVGLPTPAYFGPAQFITICLSQPGAKVVESP